MEMKKNLKKVLPLMASVAIILGVLGCSGDVFHKYELSRSDNVNPYIPNTEPPHIVSAVATDKDKVVVTFNEEIEQTSAEEYTNYYVQGNNRVNVLASPPPVLDADKKTVTLTLTSGLQYGMHNGQEYTLLVQRVKDLEDNAILNEFANFIGRGSLVAEIWKDASQMPQVSPYPSFNSSTLEFTIKMTGVTLGKYAYSKDGEPFSGEIDLADPLVLSGLSEGFHSLKVVGKNDDTGEWQELGQSTATQFVVDTVPPLAVLSRTPASVTTSREIAVMVEGDGVDTYTYKINSDSWSGDIAVGNAIFKEDLPDGNYTLYVRGKDAAGNEQATDTTVSWTVSTTTPVAVLSNVPARYTRLRNATIIVGGNDVYYYRYKVNSDAWSDYQSTIDNINLAGMTDGDYTITVIGAQRAGDPSSEGLPVAYTWTVDNVAPECSLSNLPMNPTNSQNTNIVVSSAAGDVRSYKYRLITNGVPGELSGSYSTSMPIELKSLAENTYTIKVVGVDAAGNAQSESTAAEWSWTTDITPPRATFTGVPDINTAINDIDIGVGPAGAVSYKYILDGVTWSGETSAASKITRLDLADGYHTLSVIVRDQAGNWQSLQDPTEHLWQIDTVPPTVVLSDKPAKDSSVQTADIAVGGVGVSSYQYRLNGGGWSAEYDRFQYPSIPLGPLAEGSYTIDVKGVDLADNWQLVPTSYTWSVNFSVPTAQLTGAPATMTTDDSILITVDGVVSYKYKLDGSAWSIETGVATPISASGLSDGPHTLMVIGKSALDTWQEVAAATTIDWTIDTIAPMAELSNKPANPTSSQSVAMKVAGIGIYSYKYALDNPDPRGSTEVLLAGDDTINIDNIAAGNHTVYVIGRDEAGNWQDHLAATSYTWAIDTSVPVAEFVPATLPTNPTSSTMINISVGGTGVTAYRYKIDAAPAWSGELATSTQISRSALAAGSHTVYAIAKNSAGIWQAEGSATAHAWTIDLTPPSAADIILGNLPDDPTADNFIDVTVSGTGITHYQYKINSEDWSADVPVGTNISRSGLVDNSYTLYVVARDSVGNWLPRESAKSYSWQVDSLTPIAAITNRPDNPTNLKTASFIIAGTGIIEYKYSFDGGAWSGWTDVATHINLASLSDKEHTILVCGRKAVGPGFEQEEADATSYSWAVDTMEPTAVLSNLPVNPTTNTSINVTVGGAGVVAYRYRMNGGAWVPALSEVIVDFPVTMGGLAVQEHKIEVIGRDEAGNWQITPTPHTWTIEPPLLVSPQAYDAGDKTTSAAIAFSWIRPAGTADVKIVISSKSDFSEIIDPTTGEKTGDPNGVVIGNSDSYNLVVKNTEVQQYFAKVSVNSTNGLPANDASWKAWGLPSDGIYVTGGITGSVQDAVVRTPISAATVELQRASDSFVIETTQSDVNGDFAFVGIPVGSNYYKIIVSKTGYGSAVRNNITVALGSTTNAGTMYIVPAGASTGRISGRSLDANDAGMLAGTKVEIFDWQNVLMDTQTTLVGGGDPYNPGDTVIGTFQSKVLDPGVYSVKFSRGGYYDLMVDNVVVNGDRNISNQAICAHLIEPQVRVILLWGSLPDDLDLHLAGPTSVTQGSSPTNRFHIYYGSKSFNEATGTNIAGGDTSGTMSTSSLVQDVYPGNPLTPSGGFGPEAINLWRYGGVQYARGTYTYSVRNYSQTDWYAGNQDIIIRVYDSQGMRREILMPLSATTPFVGTERDWKALRITIEGNSRVKRYLYVPTQNVLYNAGANNSKPGYDW